MQRLKAIKRVSSLLCERWRRARLSGDEAKPLKLQGVLDSFKWGQDVASPILQIGFMTHDKSHEESEEK